MQATASRKGPAPGYKLTNRENISMRVDKDLYAELRRYAHAHHKLLSHCWDEALEYYLHHLVEQ